MRMLDRHGTNIFLNLAHRLKDMKSIDVTAVAQWFIGRNAKEHWDRRDDYEAQAVPWEFAWFEYTQPSKSNCGGTIIENPASGWVVGTCTQTRAIKRTITLEPDIFFIVFPSLRNLPGLESDIDPAIRKDCRGQQIGFAELHTVFVEVEGELKAIHAYDDYVLLDRAGRFLHNILDFYPESNTLLHRLLGDLNWSQSGDDPLPEARVLKELTKLSSPVSFCLGMLHTNNFWLEEDSENTNLIKYSTLVVRNHELNPSSDRLQ